MFRRKRYAALVLLLALEAGGMAWGQQPQQAAQYDTRVRPLPLVPPGTVVDDRAPAPWTHLIIKTHPRLAPEDTAKVSSITARLAQMIFTAFLAQVEPPPPGSQEGYRLARVGVGLGTKLNGRDVVLSPDTAKQLGANLGFLERMVLDECYKTQQQGRIIANSRTMALIDTPAVLMFNGRNYPVTIRYALLVEPLNGVVIPLTWMVTRAANGQQGVSGPLHVHATGGIQTPLLYVDQQQFTFGVPSQYGFGIKHIPTGKQQLPFYQQLALLAGLPQLSPAQAQELEARLRGLLQNAVANRR